MLLSLLLSCTIRHVESRSVVPPYSETDSRPLFLEPLNQKNKTLRSSESSINIYQKHRVTSLKTRKVQLTNLWNPMPRLNMHKCLQLFSPNSMVWCTEGLYLLLLLLKMERYCSVISSLKRFIINPWLQTGSWSRMLNQTLSGITYVSAGCMFYCWANSQHYGSSPTYATPVRFMTLWMVPGTGG